MSMSHDILEDRANFPFVKLLMRHIFMAGHENEGAEGGYLIPLWKKGMVPRHKS